MQLVSGTKQQNLQCVFITAVLTVPLSYLQLIVAVTLRWYYPRWWQSVNWICNFLLPIYHLTLVGRVALMLWCLVYVLLSISLAFVLGGAVRTLWCYDCADGEADVSTTRETVV